MTKEAMKYEIEGKLLTAKEIAKIAGVDQDTIRVRYKKGIRGKDLIAKPTPFAERSRMATKGWKAYFGTIKNAKQ